AGVENGVQCPLHRLVHGRRVLFVSQLQVTTLSAPNDASFNFGIRVEARLSIRRCLTLSRQSKVAGSKKQAEKDEL
ncbi:hypothetical protein, partial [Prosthecobacter sp.]|uniref:hypothetical protein n=1 Tax=Prosthecobacter sp. TaxID=1965333 RepID=UPI0037837E3E